MNAMYVTETIPHVLTVLELQTVKQKKMIVVYAQVVYQVMKLIVILIVMAPVLVRLQLMIVVYVQVVILV